MNISIQSGKSASVTAVALPYGLYIVHSLFFRDWLIDDAGISIAYARNLVDGHGLVSQAGMEPVEGFSNLLWVVLLTPFFLLKVFHPLMTMKMLSWILVLGSFLFIFRSLALLTNRYRVAAWLVLTFLAVCTPFTVWTNSGLENPLYAFLVSILLYLILRYLTPGATRSLSVAGLAGLIAALIALTRPDGILYCLIFPALLVLCRLDRFKSAEPARRWDFFAYAASFLLPYGAFLLFRFLYFGELVPNTYFAKEGSDLFVLKPYEARKVLDLYSSTLPAAGEWLTLALLPLTVLLVALRRFDRRHLAVLMFFLCSTLVYALLPEDWMGEYRFATPFYIIFYLYLFLSGEALFEMARARWRTAPVAATSCIVLVFAASLFHYSDRTRQYSSNPALPFERVADRCGHLYNIYADTLGLTDASILLPDLGGTLYYSRLKVYDLAGLCDRTIARTLYHDPRAFHDYVFETLRPTFIHTHSSWSEVAAFHEDYRFERDYVPIRESMPLAQAALQESFDGHVADYVRRDALGSDDSLEKLRQIVAR